MPNWLTIYGYTQILILAMESNLLIINKLMMIVPSTLLTTLGSKIFLFKFPFKAGYFINFIHFRPNNIQVYCLFQGVEALTEAVITLTPTKFTFELESEP